MFLKKFCLFLALLIISNQISAAGNFALSPEYQECVLSKYNRLKDSYFFDLSLKYDKAFQAFVAFFIAMPTLFYATKKIYNTYRQKNREIVLPIFEKIAYFTGIAFSSFLTLFSFMLGCEGFEEFLRRKEHQEITKLELIHMMKKIHGKFYIH